MRIPGLVAAVVFALLSMVGAAAADVLYAVAPPYFVVRFDSASPGVLQQVVVISGLQTGERIGGIDFRRDSRAASSSRPATSMATASPTSSPRRAPAADRTSACSAASTAR